MKKKVALKNNILKKSLSLRNDITYKINIQHVQK